jgi:beta-galactosidase/beta-glucuronidase
MTMREQDVGIEPIHSDSRPQVSGKFIFAGGKKLRVRGVTYGAFEPDANGNEYHDLAQIEKDFELMAANGMNAVRIPHTSPPRGVLDVAEKQGLRVMVGLSVEQEIGYFIDRKKQDLRRIEDTLRSKVRECAGHPALLCFALGNEIPASIARWIGRRRVERILQRMYGIIKEEDPGGLVTYVNYPTTE